MPVLTNHRDQSLVVSSLLTKEEAMALQQDWTDLKNAECWQERRVAGCSDLLEKFMASDDFCLKHEVSLAIWNLLDIASIYCSPIFDMEDIFEGRYYYKSYGYRFCDYFVTTELRNLRKLPWLLNNKGKFVTAQQLSKQTLSKEYKNRDTFDDIGLNRITRFLRIKDENEPTFEELSPEMQKQIELGRELQKVMEKFHTKDSRKIINAMTMLVSSRISGDAEDYND